MVAEGLGIHRFRNILVPIGGDPSRQPVLIQATRLAKQNGAAIKVIAVMEGVGGVFVAAGSSAEIEQTIIMKNQALGGAGGSDGQGVGGGIYIEPLAVVCLDTKTKVKHNTASTSNDDIFGTFTIC